MVTIRVYYYKADGIKAGKLNCVVGQEDHVLTPEELESNPAKQELYSDTLIWEGDTPLMAGYPLEDEHKPGYIRLATRVELIKMKKDKLLEGEVIRGDEVVKIDKPNEYAVWKTDHWETDFDSLPTGVKVIDRELQSVIMIESPNSYATWDKASGSWVTDVQGLPDGCKLFDDQHVEYIDRPNDDNEHKWEWNKSTFTWDNTITEEELTANYHKIVSSLKNQCLLDGFIFRGYRQKCRTLDITWLNCRLKETYDHGVLNNHIDPKYTLLVDRSQLKKVGWVFDHNEVLLMDVLDFKEMFDKGAEWNQAVYTAEEILKSSPADFEININVFKATVGELTEVECYVEE